MILSTWIFPLSSSSHVWAEGKVFDPIEPTFGVDLVHDQRVPIIGQGGDDTKAAGHDLAGELSKAPRPRHVLVDANKIGSRAVELHVRREVTACRLEVVLAPCLEVSPNKCDRARFHQ